MHRYYKVDIRRLPLSLLWGWGYRGRRLVYAAVRKALPIPWFGSLLVPADPGVDTIPAGQVEPDLLQMVDPPSSELIQSGFRPIAYYANPSLGLGPFRSLCQALLSAEGTIVALCVAVRGITPREPVISLVSQTSDARILTTGSQRRPMPAVPGVERVLLSAAPPSELLAIHSSRLDTGASRHFEPGDVVPLVVDLQARRLAHYTKLKL